MERENGRRWESTAAGFGLGLVAGVTLGVGVGLLLAPKEGAALRHELNARARKLRDDAQAMRRRVEARATELADQGADLANRVRTATGAGVREARKHMATPREPSRAGLAGVEGLGEPS